MGNTYTRRTTHQKSTMAWASIVAKLALSNGNERAQNRKWERSRKHCICRLSWHEEALKTRQKRNTQTAIFIIFFSYRSWFAGFVDSENDSIRKVIFALIIHLCHLRKSRRGIEHFSFCGSTWQTHRRLEESGTSRFGCFSVSHFHIVCRNLYGNSSRRARLPRTNIEFERILMGACIILPACRQTGYEQRKCVNSKRGVRCVHMSIAYLSLRFFVARNNFIFCKRFNEKERERDNRIKTCIMHLKYIYISFIKITLKRIKLT